MDFHEGHLAPKEYLEHTEKHDRIIVVPIISLLLEKLRGIFLETKYT